MSEHLSMREYTPEEAYEKGYSDGRNATLRAQENEPLTEDQLSTMAEKPYWHVSLQGHGAHWEILEEYVAKRPKDYHYGERWIAYAHEPKSPDGKE